MKVFWTAFAVKNVQDIFDYILDESRSKDRAGRQLRRIVRRGRSLAEFPGIGRSVPEFQDLPVREVVEGSYRIIYWLEPRSKAIHILTVHHGKKSLIAVESLLEEVVRMLSD